MGIVYEKAREFKRLYPATIAFRIKAHAKVAERFVGSDEEVKYVFVAQKNFESYEIVDTYIVVLTNRRLLIATKRVVFGYSYKAITPDMFNDLTIKSGLLWGKIIIDTVKEKIILSNIDKAALAEIEQNVSKVMMEEKRKYVKENEKEEE